MLDLPLFAIVRCNSTLDLWELMAMNDLTRYEQAKSALDRFRSQGYDDCYLVALAFIDGPSTMVDEPA